MKFILSNHAIERMEMRRAPDPNTVKVKKLKPKHLAQLGNYTKNRNATYYRYQNHVYVCFFVNNGILVVTVINIRKE